MASNRETARDALAALIDTQMVDTDGIVQEVFNYLPADFAGKSPVLVVTSAGSLRTRMTALGSRAQFLLQVDWFVLYNDGAGWDEADAEDRLDLIEQTLAALVDANQSTAPWSALSYAQATTRNGTMVSGGVPYAWESALIAAEVMA